MPPNNPMTEGEALALDDIAVELEHFANCPARVLLLAGKLRALTAHTAASGGEVVWIHVDDLAVLADPDERNDTPAFASLNDVDAEYQAGMVPFYRAPPAAVPADALERLVRTWEAEGIRLNGGADKPYTNEENSVRAFVLGCCAGDLAALIPKGADHE